MYTQHRGCTIKGKSAGEKGEDKYISKSVMVPSGDVEERGDVKSVGRFQKGNQKRG